MKGGREAERKKVKNENEVVVTISRCEETTAKAFELQRLKYVVEVTPKITPSSSDTPKSPHIVGGSGYTLLETGG